MSRIPFARTGRLTNLLDMRNGFGELGACSFEMPETCCAKGENRDCCQDANVTQEIMKQKSWLRKYTRDRKIYQGKPQYSEMG